MMAAALSACGHRASQAKGTDGTDSTSVAGGQDTAKSAEPSAVSVETVKFEKSDSTAEVSVLVQWPVEGERPLIDSLRHHISELLDGEVDGPKAIQAYGKALFESVSEDWHSVYDETDADGRGVAFSKTYDITLLTDTDGYVSYFYHEFNYGGGAHGYTTEVGFTFRKSDGKQVPLLTNTDSPQLAKLVKEGVRRFFSDSAEQPLSDEALLEYLFAGDVSALDNIPLPANPPFLSGAGVVFLYTQYEIAPYSSGIITFEIPFKDIRPFLTEEAKAMIPER